MFCIKCGKELPNDAKFCYDCGNQVIANKNTRSEIRLNDTNLFKNQETYSYDFLLEYFRILVDMEKNLYMQHHIIKKLDYEIARWCVPVQIEEPDMYVGEPIKFSTSLIVLLPVGLIGGGILWFLSGIFLDILWDVYLPINLKTIIGFMIGTTVVLAILFYWLAREGHKEEIVRKEKAYNAYKEKRAVERKRIEAEKIIQNKLVSEKKIMCERINKTQNNLKKLYDLQICYPKYRNWVAVCSIYDYLLSKRCFTLIGPDGAYNLYEAELRQNLIIDKLDEIVNSLSRIEKNQLILANSIKDSNKRIEELISATNKMADNVVVSNAKLNTISNDIKGINENTAIGAYHAERIDLELDYMNRMALKSGKYKDILFNQKP